MQPKERHTIGCHFRFNERHAYMTFLLWANFPCPSVCTVQEMMRRRYISRTNSQINVIGIVTSVSIQYDTMCFIFYFICQQQYKTMRGYNIKVQQTAFFFVHYIYTIRHGTVLCDVCLPLLRHVVLLVISHCTASVCTALCLSVSHILIKHET